MHDHINGHGPMNDPESALVTGGAGFIDSHPVEALLGQA